MKTGTYPTTTKVVPTTTTTKPRTVVVPQTPVSKPVTVTPVATSSVMAMAKAQNAKIFGESHWPALYQLVSHESGWRHWAVNPSSGACGLFQALPCSKMGGMEVTNQISWGLNYIKARYGTPTGAWAFWQVNRWY